MVAPSKSKLKIAFIKYNIDWERNGIFDKYFIQTLLLRGDVDVYVPNLPKNGTPEYLIGKEFGKFRAILFKTFGPYFPTYFQVWRLLRKIESKYDLLVTDWEFYNTGNALLDSPKSVIYFATPERSFYDLHEYRIITKKNIIRRMLQHVWVSQKLLDGPIMRSCKNALLFANSNNTAKRIYKTYLKHANVIYPAPANRTPYGFKQVENFPFASKDYFISVSRLVPEKRIELCIDAFLKLKDKNLVIVGWDGTPKYMNQIKKRAGNSKNIIFLERVADAQLNWLYKNAIATLQTPMDEDYGMVPSESMELGTPVIAVNEGGYTEIVKEDCGELIIEPYSQTLPAVIKNFDRKKFDSEKISSYVKNTLSYPAFAKNIWKFIDAHMTKKQLQNKTK